ncbi:MAG: sulfurtransferase TusA family protein [Magnetococcus sp. DMHC-8]
MSTPTVEPTPDLTLDVRRLLCPLPILRAEAAIGHMSPGAILAVWATDPGLVRDLPAWCVVNGHHFLGIKSLGRELIGWVAKG